MEKQTQIPIYTYLCSYSLKKKINIQLFIILKKKDGGGGWD